MTRDTTHEEASRKKPRFAFFERSEMPLTVYAAIFITMTLLWVFQAIHEELTLGLFTELLGAAFTLFIIDTLLVRSKTKRWKVVRNHVDYLIARNINRLRDGVAVRAFGFNPNIDNSLSQASQLATIREQRARLLNELESGHPENLKSQLFEANLFADESYRYFDEKAGDLWEILNMKYSEYMDPELVSELINLHTHIKDVCAHIRQHLKAKRFPEDAAYYHQSARMGASVSLGRVVSIVNALKRQGYSEAASLTGATDAQLQPL